MEKLTKYKSLAYTRSRAHSISGPSSGNIISQADSRAKNIKSIYLKTGEANGEDFILVNRKRIRDSPKHIMKNQKQLKINNYWLSEPISTHNRFVGLSDEGEMIQTPELNQ